MERRFSVEAKTFSFSAKKGNAYLRLEEKRKRFGGFILLGTKCSDWLADAVEEAMEAQRKEDFARTFRDEVRVLKVRMGSNKAGYFLEVAVFVDGGRKGVIRLPEGRGGWGWQRFVDELRLLVAQLVEELPVVPAANAGEVGTAPSSADPAVNTSSTKLPVREAQSSVLVASLPDLSLVALRSLANDFLAKVRKEVDRVLFFGLGLKIDASSDIRRRLGQVCSRLGLKPKLLLGLNVRGRRQTRGLYVRRKVKRVRPCAGGEGVPESFAEQKPVVLLGDAAIPEAAVSERRRDLGPAATAVGSRMGSIPPAADICSDGSWLSDGSSEVVGLGPGVGLVAAASVDIVAVRDPSPAKGVLRRSSDLAGLSCGEERRPLVLDLEPVLVLKPDSVLGPDPGLVLDPDPTLDPDPGLVPKPKPAVSRGGPSGEGPVEQRDALSVEERRRKDFERVFLGMFPDSVSGSQGPDPNIPLEDGLTIPQWWLLDWLRDQVKNDEARLAYLMDVEEEARQLNKVAIPPGAVEGSELMQSELMQVVIRDLGL
jgi:hypothetical protein